MNAPGREGQVTAGLALLGCSLTGLAFFAWQWLRCRAGASQHADFGEEESRRAFRPRNAP